MKELLFIFFSVAILFSCVNDKKEYAKFLISLNETNELTSIINYLSNNYKNISNLNDQKTHETLQVLIISLAPTDVARAFWFGQ